ncbi:kinase-like protein, partial [Rhizopogon vinicolor AM-OR11-026]
NILVDSHGRAFVTDVGLSTMLDEVTESGPFYGSRLGAIRWVAPELMVTRSFSIRFPTSKSDVWSFGCNMIHVLSGQEPLSALTSDMDVVNCLVKNHVPPSPQSISSHHLSFLRQCFSLRPADRPSTDKILAFVRGEPSQSIAEMQRIVEVCLVCLSS